MAQTWDAARTPGGPIHLAGHALRDQRGEFLGLGATMMWAAWGYKFDRERLERNLRFLAEHRFDYIRALGVVGSVDQKEPWDGREIDWRWPDYQDVIAGLTDLAYDKYGLRVEWTLIGDGQINIPRADDRFALVRTFVQMAASRPEKIMHFEIANEAWQNGFDGEQGLAELRELTRYMRRVLADRGLPVLVAASSPHGTTCDDYRRIYQRGVADIATIHFDRDTSGPEGKWRPVWQPWTLARCRGLPVASNNEPIGPGSSVNSDTDPHRLVAAAIVTYLAKIPFYVFHTDAGVRGDQNLWEMPNALETVKGFAAMKTYLPPDLPNWDPHDRESRAHPFTVYAGSRPGGVWPEGGDTGVVRMYASTNGSRFVALPMGIKQLVRLRAKRALELDALDPLTGKTIRHYALQPNEDIELQGLPVFVLKGEMR